MSSNARAHHRRHASEERRRPNGHGTDWGTVPAWCADEDLLEEARRTSHDVLIQLMGERRTSAVQWAQSTGAEALEHLDIMAEGEIGETAEYYATIRSKLVEHGGWLVVAMARGSRAGAA